MKKPELMVPASSLEVLKSAVRYGADAVYIGGEVFGLRAKAKNFTIEEMKEGVEFAHEAGVKVYVTVNILAHNDDLAPALEYVKWENFSKVIKRAMIACENSGHSIEHDFPEVRKIVEAGESITLD